MLEIVISERRFVVLFRALDSAQTSTLVSELLSRLSSPQPANDNDPGVTRDFLTD